MGRRKLGLSSRDIIDWRQTTAGWMLHNAAMVIGGQELRWWVQAECRDGHISGAAQHETHEKYCTKMGKSKRFGGLPEILAFTKQDGLNAWVWTPDDRPGWYTRTLKLEEIQGAERIDLCRNRAGDHYDLLVPFGAVFDEDDVAAAFNGTSAHTTATASSPSADAHPPSASVQA